MSALQNLLQIKTVEEAIELATKGQLVGLFKMADEVYHDSRCPGVSQSMLKKFAKAPALMRSSINDEKEDTKAMKIGRLFDILITDFNIFNEKYAIMPNDKFVNDKGLKTTKTAGVWKDFVAENEGRECFVDFEVEEVFEMKKALESKMTYQIEMTNGAYQVAAFNYIEGVLCKGKCDFINDKVIVDIKSARAADEKGFKKACWEFGYHYQSGWYMNLFSYFIPTLEKMYFFCAEKTSPYLSAFYEISKEDNQWALNQNLKLLPRVAACIAENDWPGYPDCIVPISLMAHLEKIESKGSFENEGFE